MKIAIVGAGGVGGYLGGLLARAGHDVALIARGEHLRAIRERGLTIRSVYGDFEIRPAWATDNPAEVGPTELTIFTVKTYDIVQAAELARPMVGSQTTVLPLENGVESPIQLGRYFGKAAVVGGAVWVVSAVVEPGHIQQQSQFRRIVLGELDGRETERVNIIREALTQSGFVIETTQQIEKVLWTKLLFIASFSGITSVTRAPAGHIMASPESRLLLKRAMQEVEVVAQAKGILLEGDVVEQTLAFVERLEPTATSSMQRDVMAGRRLEYDALNGAVVRAGRETGAPTPTHEFLWTCLKVVDELTQAG